MGQCGQAVRDCFAPRFSKYAGHPNESDTGCGAKNASRQKTARGKKRPQALMNGEQKPSHYAAPQKTRRGGKAGLNAPYKNVSAQSCR